MAYAAWIREPVDWFPDINIGDILYFRQCLDGRKNLYEFIVESKLKHRLDGIIKFHEANKDVWIEMSYKVDASMRDYWMHNPFDAMIYATSVLLLAEAQY